MGASSSGAGSEKGTAIFGAVGADPSISSRQEVNTVSDELMQGGAAMSGHFGADPSSSSGHQSYFQENRQSSQAVCGGFSFCRFGVDSGRCCEQVQGQLTSLDCGKFHFA